MNKRSRLTLLLCVGLAMLAGCGFHLRGTSSTTFPESLSRLRVTFKESRLDNEPLLVAMKNALKANSSVVITDDPEAPVLTLQGEHATRRVHTVNENGRVSGYVLRYEVSFRLADAKGNELQPLQTVNVIRDYTFDPLNLLAKEQEEQELKRAMQRDAVQQIVRRLSRPTSPKT